MEKRGSGFCGQCYRHARFMAIIFALSFLHCKNNSTETGSADTKTSGTGTSDTVAPSVGSLSSFSGISATQIGVNWTAATDAVTAAAQLEYKLVKDNVSVTNINTIALANAKTGVDLIMNWTPNTTGYVATGLTALTTYYFAVLVRDSAGNIALYTPSSQATASTGSLVSPTFSPGAASYASPQTIAITSSSSGAAICYTLDGSAPAATTPGSCSNGTQITNGSSFSLSTNGSTLLRAIATKSGATNSGISSGSYIIDNVAPVIGSGISFSSVNVTDLTVSWGAATDNGTSAVNLQYKLVKDSANAANINSVALANAKTGSDLVMDWTANITSRIATGLPASSISHFAVLVRDALGNMALYSPQSKSTQGGANDGTFATSTGFSNGSVFTAVQRTDGIVIAGGTFTTVHGTTQNRLTRLKSDGSLDTNYAGGTGFDATVWALAMHTGDTTLVGGNFTSYNGTTVGYLSRITALTGILDFGFNGHMGTGFNNTVEAISVQSDGKIIVGGSFTYFNGSVATKLLRLNEDGSRDVSFGPGGVGPDDKIRTIALQTDGKIMIGGDFTFYNGISKSRIARLNATGTPDSSFDPGTGFDNTVQKIQIQSDGKIIATGLFTSYNGTARNRIVRILSNGQIDPTFDPGVGADGAIYGSALMTDGRMLISGAFSNYAGAAADKLLRLNSDGTRDVTFSPGAWNFGSTLTTLTLQSDGKILVGGSFVRTESGGDIYRFIRLLPGP